MNINGTLRIVGAEAFLNPDTGQPIVAETLMMMRNRPPGGTAQDRILAAPDYFREVRGKDNGDPVSVDAMVEPFGLRQILVVEG